MLNWRERFNALNSTRVWGNGHEGAILRLRVIVRRRWRQKVSKKIANKYAVKAGVHSRTVRCRKRTPAGDSAPILPSHVFIDSIIYTICRVWQGRCHYLWQEPTARSWVSQIETSRIQELICLTAKIIVFSIVFHSGWR